MSKVAIQGGVASFHDITARQVFGDEVETLKCATFREVCDAVKSGAVDLGLLAIENSIAGSILSNYGLVEEFDLKIVEEFNLRIRQQLMALPGQELASINRVMTHYMAHLQCLEFLKANPHLRYEEYYDTADAAKHIRDNELQGYAAIAGDLAAKTYGLDIIAEDIETIKQNYTRFWVLSSDPQKEVSRGEPNKSSISFELVDEVGSLAFVLQILEVFHINMSKIQSVPVIGEPGVYRFYVDCLYQRQEQVQKCYHMVQEVVKNFNILGEYPRHQIA